MLLCFRRALKLAFEIRLYESGVKPTTREFPSGADTESNLSLFQNSRQLPCNDRTQSGVPGIGCSHQTEGRDITVIPWGLTFRFLQQLAIGLACPECGFIVSRLDDPAPGLLYDVCILQEGS